MKHKLMLFFVIALVLFPFQNCSKFNTVEMLSKSNNSSLSTPDSNLALDSQMIPVEILSKPENNKYYSVYTFEMKASEKILCRIDENPFAECGSKIEFQNLSAGEHTFSAKSVKGGSESPTTNYKWKIIPLIKLTVANPTTEGTIATIKVELTIPSNEIVSFNLKNKGGSATEGLDYFAVDKTITIAKGVTQTTASIDTHTDTASESDENILLGMNNAIGGYFESNTIEVVIKNELTSYEVEGFRGNVKMVEGAGWGTCVLTKNNKLFFSYPGYVNFVEKNLPSTSPITQLTGGNDGCYVVFEDGKTYPTYPFTKPVIKLSRGYNLSCAILNDSSMECIYNQSATLPVKVFASGVLDVSASDYDLCALVKDQGVHCIMERLENVRKYPSVPNTAKMLVGVNRYFCYYANETVKCYPNLTGQEVTINGVGKVSLFPDKGSISLFQSSSSRKPFEGMGIVARSCLVDASGALKCWYTDANAIPIAGFASGIQSMAHSFSHMCLVTEDGTLKCFGHKYGNAN